MIRRYVVPAVLALIVVVVTVTTWRELKRYEIEQVAQVAEIESYAARSRLVRDVNAMLDALRDVRAYWLANGHLPIHERRPDAGLQIEGLPGIETLIYYDPEGSVRFLRNEAHPTYHYRPSESEWAAYDAHRARAARVEGEAFLPAPGAADDESPDRIEVVIARNGGTLIAIIDAGRMLDGLLSDSSPGYAVSVRWDDRVLYERDVAQKSSPRNWARDGMIRNSMDVLWQVVHAPTAELAKSMHTPAINAVLVSGLIIACLMALLIAENDRARKRAAAAEFAEDQVAKLNRGLEEQVTDRTRELAGRSADLLTITESIGHDLRNPLNSISTNTQLMELKYAAEIGEDGVGILQQTTANVRRMTEILDRLLGFAVIADATFTRRPVDMRRLVSETFEELQTSESNAAAKLVMKDVPDADADPTLVRILCMNLLSNALKYSRERPEPRIEVGSITRHGTAAYFVRDNGEGFDDDVADRLFRALERLSKGSEADGLGLGLHIAARIVRRHSGMIWAESDPGQGATFYFSLEPAAAVQSERARAGAAMAQERP